MDKKTVSIILIIFGAALLLGSFIFVLDKQTAVEPAGLGEQIFNILGLSVGAGIGIKGWMDLRKIQKDKSANEQRTQEAVDSPDSEQTMEGKGGVQKQKSVRSSGSKQTMK